MVRDPGLSVGGGVHARGAPGGEGSRAWLSRRGQAPVEVGVFLLV